jgi:hypothetical protein
MGYALITLPGPVAPAAAMSMPAEVWCRTRGARGRAEWVSVGNRFMVGRLWSAWHTHQRGVWRVGELRHGVIALRSMVADDFGTLVPVA